MNVDGIDNSDNAGGPSSEPAPAVLVPDPSAPKHPDDPDYRALYELVVELNNTVLEQASEIKRERDLLERRVLKRTAELERANLDAMYMLATAAEARDADSAEHLRRVEWLTWRLALTLGHDEQSARDIGRASVLHDVGKLHVPESILQKPGPLDEDERAVMQTHTLVGEKIISQRPFFAIARSIARHHHENFDGTGYPDRLQADGIPLAARIVRVADAFDALASERPYKIAWSVDHAVGYVRDHAGALFDPAIAAALQRLKQDKRLRPATTDGEDWMI
jgi:response regulator RpfG family c-di-GMP phosphodiesterase